MGVQKHQHLGVVDAAQGNAEKIADANIDRHLDAADGTTQHDAFAVKFDMPHTAIGAGVVRVEADRQRERVEPQCAARPGGVHPASCCFTPPPTMSPPRLPSPPTTPTQAKPL